MRRFNIFLLSAAVMAFMIWVIYKIVVSDSAIKPHDLIPREEPVACTLEAKLCPDGVTYVGRVGPDCEFEACPSMDRDPVTQDKPKTSILVPSDTDPYPPPTDYILGSPKYLVITKPISENLTMEYFDVWVDQGTGDPYNSDGKIYYNPTPETLVIEFGPEAGGSPEAFRQTANARVALQGYALVSHFWNGGPAYSSYSVAE